mmetsp:Transcript_100633/g.280268  ORF Transcript_100633/g.280268 Transcript_100633/m.280268 type:complete len:212 (+) Transcript_100633:608-1243(+)
MTSRSCAGVVRQGRLRCRTRRTSEATPSSCASFVPLSRKPPAVPAPVRILMADSSAPMHCSDSTFSSLYSPLSFSRISVASCCEARLAAISFFRFLISAPWAPISPFSSFISSSNFAMSSLFLVMSAALRPRVSSHQHWYLSKDFCSIRPSRSTSSLSSTISGTSLLTGEPVRVPFRVAAHVSAARQARSAVASCIAGIPGTQTVRLTLGK